MLPNDDSDEIVDEDNKESESTTEPQLELEDAPNKSVQVCPAFELTEEQNVREVKVLLVKDRVAIRIYTMDVPFLCNEMDIITTIFSQNHILQDELGYKIVTEDTEQRLIVSANCDPKRTYQYVIDLQSPTVKLDESLVLEEGHVTGSTNNVLPTEYPLQLSSQKLTDTQETYFEIAEEMSVDSREEANFWWCLDDENDIDIGVNGEQVDRLFALASEDKRDQDKYTRQVDKEARDNEETQAEAPSAKTPSEVDTTRFYTRANVESPSKVSEKTVQLSDSPIFARRISPRNPKSSTDAILAVYPPPPARGGITIYVENYKCLGNGQYLNDVIIDFYLKYLTNEVLSERNRSRTHVFSSQFFTRLSKPLAVASETGNAVPESERRHIGVQRWTKNVNIFEKDFVVIPINERYHWNLAIICYPGLVDTTNDDTRSSARPCILFFDSLSDKPKDRIAAILRGYLSQEYLAKTGETNNFSNGSLQIIYPRIPKQSNATDCGLYVLQYVEQFYKCPIVDFTVPLDLSRWFKTNVITRKRREIAGLITRLAKKYNPDNMVLMPALQFPFNGASSNEENFDCTFVKRKNPLYKPKDPSFALNRKLFGDAKSCSPAALKKSRSDQSSTLDEWMDGVRDASLASNRLNLSSSIRACNDQVGENDYSMSNDEDDVLLDEPENDDNRDQNEDKSLEIVSNVQLRDKCSFFPKSPQHKYSNKHTHRINAAKGSFSSIDKQIFQKTSVFCDQVKGQSFGGVASQKRREYFTKKKSEKMAELENTYQERKRKSRLKLRNGSDGYKKPDDKWIHDSALKLSKSLYNYSLLDVDDEPAISPAIGFNEYKVQRKNIEKLKQY